MASRTHAASRTTILDLARAAGVSKSTVSLVLRKSPLVHPETRRKVERAISELDYVYDRTAASLRSRRSGVAGMVLNDLTNPFFAELAVGIEAGLQGAGYVPFLANTGEDPARQIKVLRMMREHGCAGLIVSPAKGLDRDGIDELRGFGLPVVAVTRRLPVDAMSSVVPDDRGGAYMATRHLLALGHRAIAFLGGQPGATARPQRTAGWRAALDEAGIDADPSWSIETADTRSGGIDALRRALALPRPATAAVCYNDIVAIGALHGLAACGRVSGRDFAVVGFDDVEDAGLIRPRLTTVRIDTQGLGARAAGLLLEQLADATAKPRHVVTPVCLVIRESCGATAESRNG